MINLNVARDFHLYQNRLAENPDAVSYFFRLPESPQMIQYHNTGREIFGAVFALPANNPCRDFRAYLPKVELN